MKFINLIFMLISINFISYEVSATGLGDLEEVYTLFMNIWTRVDEGIEEANTGKKPKYQATLFGDKTSSMLEALNDKVDELSVQIESMQNRLMDKMQEIADAVKAVPEKVEKDRLLTKISYNIKSIKESYREVKKLGSKNITQVKAKRIIDKYVRDKITDDLREIFLLVLPDESDLHTDRSLLKLLINLENNVKEIKERCDKKNSPQQFLYQLYLTLVSTEMIGYTSLAYGFGVNELINPDEKADVEIQTNCFVFKATLFEIYFIEKVHN
ncbi:hypothetical protein HCN44_011243 [Aphidius gifuensis]|uniref:Uncharacterized protein n=1 Tax=Aphidius gifuensis TaxID=684658 RepID=A0A835CRH7_APHGI|nr:hypothetical protein HCN44_011243 [Aphidius gifuensis]